MGGRSGRGRGARASVPRLHQLQLYCQICKQQFQARHAYASHLRSPAHLAQTLQVAGSGLDTYVARHSAQFERQFLTAFRDQGGTAAGGVQANRVYQAIIREPDHVRMTATRWATLAEFLQHLLDTDCITVVTASAVVHDCASDPRPF